MSLECRFRTCEAQRNTESDVCKDFCKQMCNHPEDAVYRVNAWLHGAVGMLRIDGEVNGAKYRTSQEIPKPSSQEDQASLMAA